MMKLTRLVKGINGFTLVELLAVIVILGIVFSIAKISLGGTRERVEEDVCAANRVELENQYKGHLALEVVEHSDVMFSTFLKEFDSDEVCPVGGVITYTDGHIDCSVHSPGVSVEHNSGNEGGVPFL
jgi:prepilin-type N-terminal cleavage/methylation domain-containing protein